MTDLYSPVRDFELKGRGISILISDFFSGSPVSEIIKYLQYNRQDVFACHILAPEELEPSIESGARLVDVETGEVLDVTATPALAWSYDRILKKFVSDIEKACFSRGAGYFMMSSAMQLEHMVKMVVRGR